MNLLQYLSIRKLKPLVKLVDAKWHYRKKLCKVPTAQSHMLDLGVHLVMSPRMLKQQLKKPNGCIMAVYVLSQQQGIQSWCHLQPGCQPGPNNFYRVGGTVHLLCSQKMVLIFAKGTDFKQRPVYLVYWGSVGNRVACTKKRIIILNYIPYPIMGRSTSEEY